MNYKASLPRVLPLNNHSRLPRPFQRRNSPSLHRRTRYQEPRHQRRAVENVGGSALEEGGLAPAGTPRAVTAGLYQVLQHLPVIRPRPEDFSSQPSRLFHPQDNFNQQPGDAGYVTESRGTGTENWLSILRGRGLWTRPMSATTTKSKKENSRQYFTQKTQHNHHSKPGRSRQLV